MAQLLFFFLLLLIFHHLYYTDNIDHSLYVILEKSPLLVKKAFGKLSYQNMGLFSIMAAKKV